MTIENLMMNEKILLFLKNNPKKNWNYIIYRNLKCSYAEICKNLYGLKFAGFITMQKSGRRNLIELTEKGKVEVKRLMKVYKRMR